MHTEQGNNSNQSVQATGSSSQQKIKLSVNEYNQVVGLGSGQFKSWLGKLVRTRIPITDNDWRIVPETYKEDVWDDIMAGYSLPPCYKTECYKRMGSILRTWRSTLRSRYYNKYNTNEERLAHVPPIVKREQWKEFVEKESTADAKMKSELGKMQKKKAEPTRVEVWIESHTSKDGTVPMSLAPQVDTVKAKHKELEQTTSGNSGHLPSLERDALSHVFGKDKRGRTRGVGSTVSRTAIKASLPALSLLEIERAEGKEVKGRLNQLENYVKDINSNTSDEYNNISTSLSSKSGKSQSTDGTSEIAGVSSWSDEEEEHSSLNDDIMCEIKGFNGRVIGKGRIDNSQQEMVHGHIVDYEEVLLIVDTVLDPNACLYLGQQGGAKNLGDMGNGRWVVWLKSLVKRTL